jgi:hypothetical protein
MSNVVTIPDEPMIPLAAAARQKLHRCPSPVTLWRWHVKGVKIRGRVVRLTCWRSGGKWLTTASAFAEFLKAQTEAGMARPSDEPAHRSSDEERRLRAAGLLRKKPE